MRHIGYLIATSCLLLLTAVVAACGGGKDRIIEPPIEEAPMPQPQEPQTAILLFDNSASMRGYLGSETDTRFQETVAAYLNLADDTKVYKYANNPEHIDKQTFVELLNKNRVIDGKESDLIGMIGFMKAACADNDVCVLVSDGILSGSNDQIEKSDSRAYNYRSRGTMAAQIGSMLKRDSLSALVIRYTSRFDGTYYDYKNNRETNDAPPAPIILHNDERPFFVIALGKWEYIKYLEQHCAERDTLFTDMVMIGDSMSYKQVRLLGNMKYMRQNRENRKWTIDIKSDSIVLTAKLNPLPTYMRTARYMKDNMELAVKKGRSDRAKMEKDRYGIDIDSTGCMLSLSIKSRDIKDLNGSVLTVKLNYALPEWVNRYHDDDDRDMRTHKGKHLHKTFSLKYLIDGFKALNHDDCIMRQTFVFTN